MKIIFLNTWFGQLTEEISQFLEKHAVDTDVFCLQEMDGAIEDICEKIFTREYTKISMRKPTPFPNDKYSQVIYVRNTLPIVDSERLCTNSAETGLGISVHLLINDQDVHISNIHRIPQPGKLDTPGRIKQSQTIIDAYRKKSGLKIIGGDFNVLPETESVRMFEKEGYKNLIAEYNISTTRNRLTWEKYPGNELYYSDYVFVSQDVSVTSFSVPNILISDHLPMILTIDL